MPKFKVTYTNKRTGRSREMVVEASSEGAALEESGVPGADEAFKIEKLNNGT